MKFSLIAIQQSYVSLHNSWNEQRLTGKSTRRFAAIINYTFQNRECRDCLQGSSDIPMMTTDTHMPWRLFRNLSSICRIVLPLLDTALAAQRHFAPSASIYANTNPYPLYLSKNYPLLILQAAPFFVICFLIYSLS